MRFETALGEHVRKAASANIFYVTKHYFMSQYINIKILVDLAQTSFE